MRLDQCCEIVAGATPSTSESEYWGGDICWATPKDLSDLTETYIRDTPRKLTKSGLDSCAATVLPPRSVLFSSRAPIGHVAINTVPMATNQGFKSFVPKDDLVHPEFLFYWLRFHRGYLESLGNGATFKEVSKGVISRVEINLPPVGEQRRIAAILDQAETLRTQRRTALALLDSLTQSLFLDMFGDLATNPKRFQAKSLCEVATFYGGNSLPSGLDFTDQVGGYFLMKVSDMNLPGNEREILQCQSWSDVAGSKASTCPVGSIVVPKRGGAIGTNKKRITTRPTVLDPNLMAICPDPDQLNQEFLFQWFLGFDLASIASGSSVPQLNKQDLAPLTMLVPPLPLQQTFATRIASIEALKATHRRALAALDALFASLQQRAFAGAL